ncbi:hypothetical protein V502_06902 [Pseudogymnoascus sp. VKM F-4520 (FW-2644)]|nr:hypothetical protein V502_06902 [Pseudogymnoascus sp. VKM F-4520 (FW-2644)]
MSSVAMSSATATATALNPSSEIKYIKRTAETVRDIAGDVVQLLKDAGETVGVAESLTGGGIMAALTSVEGASAVFRGGVVSYATPLKQLLLHVDAELISRHGVIHGEVAAQMAAGARTITTFDGIQTTWGIGTTGVAGPDSQDGKPVGMVFIAIASASGSQGLGPFHFPSPRDRVREATVIEALNQLRKALVARSHESFIAEQRFISSVRSRNRASSGLHDYEELVFSVRILSPFRSDNVAMSGIRSHFQQGLRDKTRKETGEEPQTASSASNEPLL